MRKSRQRGMAVPLVVVMIGTAILAMIVGANLLFTKQVANRFAEDREAYLDEVRTHLEAWYGRNTAGEGDQTFNLASDDLFVAIGVEPRYGARLTMSSQLNDGVVAYHKVAIVVPEISASPPQNATYGAYGTDGTYKATAGFVVKEFDGRDIQHKAYSESTRNMQTVATMLEQRAKAKMQLDATREGTTNYFVPRIDCYHVGDDEFPCTNGWVSLSSFFANSPVLGAVDGVPVKSAWGTDIMISNDDVVNSVTPPYTISLMTVTPWGKQIDLKAVQPIF